MSNEKTMDEVLEIASQILIRCAVMGVVALLLWWGVLEVFGDLAYGVHSRLAPMTREQFRIIHYVAILATKTGVSLLFLFPYIAIRLVIRKRRRQSPKQSL